jgi:hypothetical protein
VILDLEAQERMDSRERFGIAGHNPHPSTGWRFCVPISDAVLEPRHVHGPGHLLAVRERWLAEIACFEQSGDLLEVLPNRAKVRSVAGVLHDDVDGSAVRVQQKVVIRALLIKAHGLSATSEHVSVMRVVIVFWSLLRLLGSGRSRQPRSGCSNDNHISKSMRHKVPPTWRG